MQTQEAQTLLATTVALVARWHSVATLGPRQGKLEKSGQGPAGRVLAVGVSPLQRRERRPPLAADPCSTHAQSRVLQCFLLLPLFPALWLKMGQHGPT